MAPTRERTPYAVAARQLLRDTLLDAARDLLDHRVWADITMADVADAAGVSRQTLYKEFGSRAEFAQAFVVREGERFLVAVEDAVLAHRDDPEAALTAAFELFLTTAAGDPLVRMLTASDGTDGLLPLVTTRGQPLVASATERLAAVVVSGWPQVPAADAALLADCLVRLAISYAALPGGSAEATAASVTRLLGPFLERVLGENG